MPRSWTIALLLVPLALSGCGRLMGEKGYFRDRSDDYRKARAIPPMQIPEGKHTDAIDPIYAIPVERTDALLGEKFEVPRPAPLVGDQGENVVRIQKLDKQQWILVEEPPGQTWPRIRTFLLANHIDIEHEDPATGVMETAWLGFKTDEARREKYRFRMEQGVQRNSTEIYVLQKGYQRKDGVDPQQPEWGDASMDAERESWMVRQLATYIADTSSQSSVSLLAQGISTVSKVYLVRDESNKPVIDLRLPFDRAWASLERALDRSDFSVSDKDIGKGLAYIKFDPNKNRDEGAPEEEKKKGGFFHRIRHPFGGDKDKNPVEGKVYRVEMRRAGDGVLIGVARDDGKDFEAGEAEYVLSAIKTHLA